MTSCAKGFSHQIILTDSTVVKCQPYRVSNQQQAEMGREIQRMLKDNSIRHNKSPYALPALLVPKPKGSWRFVVDYTKLNLKTKSDNYPFPNTHSQHNCMDQQRLPNSICTRDFGRSHCTVIVLKT